MGGISDFSEKPGAFGIFFEKFESSMRSDIVLVLLNLMIVRKYSFTICRIPHRSAPIGMGYLLKTQLEVGMTYRSAADVEEKSKSPASGTFPKHNYIISKFP